MVKNEVDEIKMGRSGELSILGYSQRVTLPLPTPYSKPQILMIPTLTVHS